MMKLTWWFLFLLLSVLAGCQAGAYEAYFVPSTIRAHGPTGLTEARRDELRSLADSQTADITLAQDEWEGVQLVVDGAGENSEVGSLKVKIQVVPVESTSSRDIHAPSIRLYQVLDVHHTGPAENATFAVPPRNLGWIPDMCVPTNEATEQPHRPGEVTFFVDFGADHGLNHPLERPVTYEYAVEIYIVDGQDDEPTPSQDNTEYGHLLRRKFRVTIEPRQIPRPLPFKTAVTWNWGIEKYLGRSMTPRERLAYLDFFLDYRFTPASFFSRGLTLTEEELRHVMDRGGNVVQLYHIGHGGSRSMTDKQKEALQPKLVQWRDVLKRVGALDCTYALIADEPRPESIETIRANAKWLKSVFPELRIWIASRPTPGLMDTADLWDPVTAHSTEYYADHSYTPESLATVRALNRPVEYWWFWSVEPYEPQPNCRIDNTLEQVRSIGRLSYKAGVDGFEYFWATDWAANADLRKLPVRQRAARWNLGLSGAGQLCYPGDDGLPLPSLRLINLRDAFEDWAKECSGPDK